MKVRCINVDPMTFPVGDLDKRYYTWWLGREDEPKLYDGLSIGSEYVVYAIKIYTGRPFYYVKYGDQPERRRLVPALCFEVIDPAFSKFWNFHVKARDKRYITTLAIRPWVEQDDFFARLVEGDEAEMASMREAVAAMDAEYAISREEISRSPQ